MRLLLTGGLGLIGRGVLRRLARSAQTVSIRIADLGNPPRTETPGIEFLQGDICDPAFVQRAVRGCDAVIHLAGHLGVAQTEQDHLTCLDTNVVATRTLLAACVEHQVRRVVLASSSEVYGEADGRLSETTQVKPRSVYACAKLCGEKYAFAYAQRHGLDARVVRFFNVYGPWQRNDFVVSSFIRNLRAGRPPEVFGEGTQVRSFCHVDDAARGVLLVLQADGLSERVFNIGNANEPVQMRELAQLAIKLSGQELELTIVPFQTSDRSATREIQSRIPDITRARALLQYEPRVGLREGLSALLHGPELDREAGLFTHGRSKADGDVSSAAQSFLGEAS